MILIVDDQPDSGRLLCRVMERCGYRSYYCQSAGEALDAVRTVRPQVAVLDIMMPGLDGLELLAALRAIPEMDGLAVVMFTASPEASHRRRATELGAVAFLTKGSASVVDILAAVGPYCGGGTRREPGR